jgi:hypothetical protein
MNSFKKRKCITENNISLDHLESEINQLKIDPNKELLTKIMDKMNNLEKKVDTLLTLNIKIDNLKRDIDKILIEKDYIIENLHYEINDMKQNYIKEQNTKHNEINSYYC